MDEISVHISMLSAKVCSANFGCHVVQELREAKDGQEARSGAVLATAEDRARVRPNPFPIMLKPVAHFFAPWPCALSAGV